MDAAAAFWAAFDLPKQLEDLANAELDIAEAKERAQKSRSGLGERDLETQSDVLQARASEPAQLGALLESGGRRKDSVLDVVAGQRDRFKRRAAELEAEVAALRSKRRGADVESQRAAPPAPLSFPERVALSAMRYRPARNFLFAYLAALHVFVFFLNMHHSSAHARADAGCLTL